MSHDAQQRKAIDAALAPFLVEEQQALLVDIAAAVVDAIEDGTLKVKGRLVRVQALFAAAGWQGTALTNKDGELVFDLEEGSDVVYDGTGQYAVGLTQPVQIYLQVPDP